jgi:hypothetical protein
MNRCRTIGVPAAAAMRGTAFSSSRGLENTVDNIGQLRSVRRRLPGVNLNQKGLRRQPAESRRLRLWRDQSRHSMASAAMLARVEYGNGDPAWP